MVQYIKTMYSTLHVTQKYNANICRMKSQSQLIGYHIRRYCPKLHVKITKKMTNIRCLTGTAYAYAGRNQNQKLHVNITKTKQTKKIA